MLSSGGRAARRVGVVSPPRHGPMPASEPAVIMVSAVVVGADVAVVVFAVRTVVAVVHAATVVAVRVRGR
jgi:hypothetical protein